MSRKSLTDERWDSVLRYILYRRRTPKGASSPMSFRALAARLMADGVATKSGGRTWCAEQVKRAWMEASRQRKRLVAKKKPRRKQQRRSTLREDQWLSSSEMRKKIRGSAKKFLLTIDVLLMTGVRVSELCALEVRDTRFRSSPARLVVRRGKGHKRREVVIPDDLRRRLAAEIRRRGASGDDPLLVNSKGSRWSRQGVWAMVKRVGEAAGIEGVYPHRFRHTYATVLSVYDPGMICTKDQLGHKDLRMVQIYAHTAKTRVSGILREAQDELLGEQ